MALVLLLIVGCIIGVGVRYSILHTKKNNTSNNHMAIYVPNDNGEGFQLSNLQKIPKGYKLNVEETNAHCSDGLTASWDDTTKTVSINATKSGGCNLYLEKEICHWENNKFVDCPSTFSIGDRIAIGDQVFIFIRYTSTTDQYNECGGETGTSTACADSTNGDIRMIAEYNLYRGNIADGNSWAVTGTISSSAEGYGLQSSSALGYKDGDSTFNGTTAFSSDEQKGTNYSTYSGSIIEEYVEDYVDYLNTTYGITVSGDLITKAELEYLGCDGTNNYTCSSAPSWIYTTSFWSGSPNYTDHVWYVDSNAYFGAYFYYDTGGLLGVRPVITISESYFN